MQSVSGLILGAALVCLIVFGACAAGRDASSAQSGAAAAVQSTPAQAQASPEWEERPAPRFRSVKRVLKKDGWEIPGLEQSTEQGPVETYLTKTVSPKINVTAFRPSGDYRTVVYRYHADGAGEVILAPQKVKIEGIQRYNFGDRPFSYLVIAANLLEGEAQAGHPQTRTAFQYYDDDGDGRFETFDSAGSTPDTRLPAWVQELTKAHP